MIRKLIAFMAILVLVCGVASAANTTVNATNVTKAAPLYPVFNETIRIENGGCVPLNATVDIAPLGWGVPKISYYGRYETAFSISNETETVETIKLPNTVSKLSNYFISPSIFGKYIGFWYQNYDQNNDDHGNTRMFYVNYTCPPKKKETIVPNYTTTEKIVPDKLKDLDERRAASILIARGDDSMIQIVDTPARWWLFGRVFGVMDEPVAADGKFFIPSNKTLNFETGNYDLILIQPGPNKLYEEEYKKDYKYPGGDGVPHKVIISPIRSVEPIDITSMVDSPKVVEDRLVGAVKASIDDNQTRYTVSFQEPEIQITRLDVLTNPSNDTWYDLRGYTNMANGTVLTVKIDPVAINSKNRQFRVFTTKAEGADPGVWRQFNTIVPIIDLAPGFHDIEVSAPNGAKQTVQIYRYKELAPHFIPPQFVEYDGASPFITPVTIIQTVTIPVPGPTVIIHDTPSVEQIHAQQEKVISETFWWYILVVILILIGAWLIIVGLKYAIDVYRRL